jgi:hypothetical protein
MVTVEGKMHIVTAGKRLSGIEIVSVDSPKLGLRWGETELTLDFYKPIKSNRTVRKVEPILTFSDGLTNFGNKKNDRNTSKAAPNAPLAPRPPNGLPSLPSLPQPGDDIPGSNLSVVPDLGSGSGAQPAP